MQRLRAASRPMFALALALLAFSAVEAKRLTLYIPPKFWTRITVDKCKLTSGSSMHCECEVVFAGYSLQPAGNEPAHLPVSQIELGDQPTGAKK